MRIEEGTKVINLVLPNIENGEFDMRDLYGKPFMLSFFRFASCPFCNMRMHELVKRYHEFGDEFEIVAIFDSPLDNLQKHASRHQPPFPILADPDNKYYKMYGIEHSISGVVKGMVTRLPTLIKGMSKGYLPTTLKGSITTMPADFLVDREGTIQTAYYGKDEGDHLPIKEVRSFSLQ